MSNLSSLLGGHWCPPPFLLESDFPQEGGYIGGRLCSQSPILGPGTSCCIPCPATDWIYPDNFYELTRIVGFINYIGLGCCLFMLLSFAVLPASKTGLHYLNVCLLVGIVFVELGFVVPVTRKPHGCYNEITPHWMRSDATCATSGAFLVWGGVATASWVLVRALSMHLQICWDIQPAKKFHYAAHLFAWGISTAVLALTLSLSGLSFRFGDYCFVNHPNSAATLWGPLMGIGGVCIVLQVATFIYCMHIYLRNLRSDRAPSSSGGSSHAMSLAGTSVRAQTARAVYRRISQVLRLQWRGLAIASLVVIDIVYFSIVFVYLDNRVQERLNNLETLMPWAVCLIANAGDKNMCLELGSKIAVDETTLMATLMMLSIVGIEAAFLIGRWTMITGWISLVRSPRSYRKDKNFIRLIPGHLPDDKSTGYFKLGTPGTTTIAATTPGTDFGTSNSPIKSPAAMQISAPFPTPSQYFENPRDLPSPPPSRSYNPPRMSFSTPRSPSISSSARPPTMIRRMGFEDDPALQAIKMGLGLAPTYTVDEEAMSEIFRNGR